MLVNTVVRQYSPQAIGDLSRFCDYFMHFACRNIHTGDSVFRNCADNVSPHNISFFPYATTTVGFNSHYSADTAVMVSPFPLHTDSNGLREQVIAYLTAVESEAERTVVKGLLTEGVQQVLDCCRFATTVSENSKGIVSIQERGAKLCSAIVGVLDSATDETGNEYDGHGRIYLA